jgi:predicted metalloprotease with PDZ domain
MKKIVFLFAFVCQAMMSHAQTARNNSYQYSIDLTNATDDKLSVHLIVPKLKTNDKDEISYFMSKIVPGTYSIYDFGRFVSEFQATDSLGKPLNVLKLSDNEWKIMGASKLYKISYKVEDTYDTQQGNFIFEPAGTNIEVGSNFILNTHGFFGYFANMKRNNYTIQITKPEGFYGSTPLQTTNSNDKTDLYTVPSFMELVDSPIMYCKPDTTVLQVGGAEILISVYSPNKVMDSKFVAKNINAILEAQKEYLGGTLPIKRYAFIIYLFSGASGSGAMGALEHSYSSLYFLPEMNPMALAQTVRDVAAHEFFHIITPLSIHSEQIHDFDYNKPEMSKHLWLYEGVVEYFAGHMQTKHGLLTMEDYLAMLRNKLVNAEGFMQNLPFTQMSKGCLDTYKDQYGNVYEKGALIGLCLDIKLRKLSKGKYGLQNLMADLAKEFGKEKAFKDDELFDKIVQITGFPELKTFFDQYVAGAEPLPMTEILAQVGIHYKAKQKDSKLSLGGISIGANDTGQIMVADISEIDALGEQLAYQTGDIILKINKVQVNTKTIADFIQNYQKTAKVGDAIQIVVQRTVAGKQKEIKLKGKVIETSKVEFHVIELDTNANAEQIALRKAWINQ